MSSKKYSNKKKSGQRFSNKNPYANFNQSKTPTPKQAIGPIFFLLLIIISIGYIVVYRSYLNKPDTNQNNSNEIINTDANENINEQDVPSQDSSNGTSDTDATISESDISDASNDSTTQITGVEDTVTVVATEENSLPSNSVQVAEDRVDYKEGFFYQSITDDIKERIYGKSYKTDCTVPYSDLRYCSVLYVDFDGNTQAGEIICNKALAKDFMEIFYELYINEYQIDKIRLVDEYDADDDISCAENNTSCFNYRTVSGSNNLSKHSLGRAIDINPFQNPYVTYPDGKIRISPEGSEPYADRKSGLPHMITEDDLCYKLFKAHGFTWGGHWKSLKDYQHFQKVD